MKKRIAAAVFLSGAGGIAAQLIILRELLIVFSGNELTIGIILANWLALEALGCYLAGRKPLKSIAPANFFCTSALFMALSLPILLFCARILKNILGIALGEGVGLLPVFYSSFLIILPAAASHGSLFTSGARMYSLAPGGGRSPAGIVYIFETAGTIAGGIAWTYLMIPGMHSFQSAAVAAALNTLACAMPFFPGRGKALKPAFPALCALFAAFSVFALNGGAERMHERSVRAQWSPHEVIHYENSVFGNVALIEIAGQYTFFTDGKPSVSTPVPDIAAAEEFVHIPMLAHPAPRRIAVLGGGAGGVIWEILKHPGVESVEYAELDPLIIDLLKKYPTPVSERELDDPRVEVSASDGRYFLRTSRGGYDLVMAGASEPSDLQTNRFFTEEFFMLAMKKLSHGGIFVIRLPGSLTYLDRELKKLNASIYYTLLEVFRHVRVLPGDGTNIFLASESPLIMEFTPEILIRRLEGRRPDNETLVPWHIEYRLNPAWEEWFMEFIEGSAPRLNRDFQPAGMFYSIARWNALFSPSLRGVFIRLEKLSPARAAAFFVFAAAILLSLSLKKPPGTAGAVPFCTATTGFAGMVFDLSLIFTFQAVYGYVFNWLGLLVASFMAGAAAGAFFTARRLSGPKNVFAFFLKTEAAVAVFALLIPAVFLTLRRVLDSPAVIPFIRPMFLSLLFSGGFLVGAQFPAAERLHMRGGGPPGATAGVIYGSDLAGGWLGGIAGGVVLLPVLGLFGSCFFVFLMKSLSLAIILTARR